MSDDVPNEAAEAAPNDNSQKQEQTEEQEQENGPTAIARAWTGMVDRCHRAGDWSRRNRRSIVRTLTTALLIAVAMAIVALVYLLAGPVATIAYVFCFIIGIGVIPSFVLTLRDVLPNFVGRLLFALGQLGYNGSWLIQTQDGWEICPRRRVDGVEQFWLDGWHDIADHSNMTRLGWAKFGIGWLKDGDQAARYRIDNEATDEYQELLPDKPSAGEIANMSQDKVLAENSQPVADGGQDSLTAEKPHELLMRSGVWVVDMRSLWNDRLQHIGEPDLLDDVERVAQREEAMSQTINQNRLMLGSAFGLILGAATGYIAMSGF